MPPEINAEKCHIGRAITDTRESYGITSHEMYVNAAPGEDNYLRWTERASRPSVTRLNWWHFLLTEALAQREVMLAAPLGMREQWWHNRHDQWLWQQAMRNRPTVGWWWAPRRTKSESGALCYACGTLIAPFDAARPVTPPVRIEVMVHRAWHITTAGDSPADLREKVGH